MEQFLVLCKKKRENDYVTHTPTHISPAIAAGYVLPQALCGVVRVLVKDLCAGKASQSLYASAMHIFKVAIHAKHDRHPCCFVHSFSAVH